MTYQHKPVPGEKRGPDFVREAILEKLQRILDQSSPARCSDCKSLTKQEDGYFCKTLLDYLGEKKLLKKKVFMRLLREGEIIGLKNR